MQKIIFIFLLIFSGCSYSPIRNVNYKANNLYTSANAGNLEYDDLGPIVRDTSGFIWDSCDHLAELVIAEVIADVKDKGGNALANVKWRKGDNMTATPYCTTKYGWFVPYIITGLGPWVKNVEIAGSAIKINSKQVLEPHSNVFYIDPNKTNEELATLFYKTINL